MLGTANCSSVKSVIPRAAKSSPVSAVIALGVSITEDVFLSPVTTISSISALIAAPESTIPTAHARTEMLWTLLFFMISPLNYIFIIVSYTKVYYSTDC